MSDKKKGAKTVAPPPTIITLTLPTPSAGGIPLEPTAATLLIQRGDLAHVRQFTYVVVDDMTTAIKEAYIALAAVEAQPPVITEPPQAAPKSERKAQSKSAPPAVMEKEPTIDIPLKKGTLAVKISHLKISGGETDAAAYRQATLIAGRLIDGKLWDGQSPIRIDDVYVAQRKLQHLADAELSLFKLGDFVQVGAAAEVEESVQAVERDAVDVEAAPLLITGLPSNVDPQQPDGAVDE